MRKFLMSAALVTASLAAAAPASAQWAPPPQGYGYGYGYNNYGQIRRLEARVDQVRRTIRQLDRRNILSDREAYRLSQEARYLDQRINMLARNGFDRRDRFDIERRLARLEQRIARDAYDGNRYGNNHGYYGNDRDRDGRIDRLEDDRGTDSDRRRHFDRDRDGRDDRYEDDRGRYPG